MFQHEQDEDLQPMAYRMRDAAKLLSVSERHLWTQVKEGRIKHGRIGRVIVIPKFAIEEYLQDIVDKEIGSLEGVLGEEE